MSYRMRRKYNTGFTLIELMIVVAIVALLAAIAYPSYTRYVEKARRADAKSALLSAAQRLERCYTQFNRYDHASCTFSAGSPDGFYTITATEQTQTTFVLQAEPQGVQTRDKCGTFTLNHLGERSDGGAVADRCWQ